MNTLITILNAIPTWVIVIYIIGFVITAIGLLSPQIRREIFDTQEHPKTVIVFAIILWPIVLFLALFGVV